MIEDEYIVVMQNSDAKLKSIISEINSEGRSSTVRTNYEIINGILN